MEIRKEIWPRGVLLSETDTGVDYLGETVYAEAIAESIHQARTAITIGIYAKWGSGKSFLLRHIESMLQRYEKQRSMRDEEEANQVQAKYNCPKLRRQLAWISALAVIFTVLALSLVLAINPAILITERTENPTLETQTTASQSPTTSSNYDPVTEDQKIGYITYLRIVGLVLVPAELVAIFGVGCFGETWMSRGHYGRVSILAYGTFTKLPIRKPENDVVEDPGQTPADVLRFAPPGQERITMAAAEEVAFPRKYIFVNFKAWEYAGSDTLWAAIVTNISDAIEAEFGAITTRLFRMLTIREVPRKSLEKRLSSMYIKFTSGTRREEILEMVKRYGIVESIKPVNVDAGGGFKLWKISYSSAGEYRHAEESLKIVGVDFKTSLPSDIPKRRRGSKGCGSTRKLVKEDIPMKGFKGREESYGQYNQGNAEESKCFCCCFCTRFWQHFARYPVKVWKLPRLFWWILLSVGAALIPIVAYIVADYLDLKPYKSYRSITLTAQVMMWLPASAAVTYAVVRFAWAMCHSQRQRIHRALDGTKGRMTSQLGFMSTVKEEVAVMTNLIRCARFVNQTDYKVIIAIDDLDQVDLKQVHSVLEAINILLSDKSSPFICIVAADPRIVVKCIESNMGQALSAAKVTGREYLKKVVNLPVCLPQISDLDKKRYIAGLIDQSDRTVTYRLDEQKERATRRQVGTGQRYRCAQNRNVDTVDGVAATGNAERELDHEDFLFECRKFLYNDTDLHRHMEGNARNIKRIFNVVSLTTSIINCLVKKQERQKFMRTHVSGGCYHAPVVGGVESIVRNKKMAEDMVLWIVFVDHWPYRVSFLLQILEDSEQRALSGCDGEKIPEEWTIREIYKNKVEKKLENPDENLITLDSDPDLFQGYLLLLEKQGFTKEHISFVLQFTINLDHSIRRTIALTLNPPPLRALEGADSAAKFGDLTQPTTSMTNSLPFQTSMDSLQETVC